MYGARRGMGRLSAAVDLRNVVLAVYLGAVCALAFLHPATSGHEGVLSLSGICLTRVFRLPVAACCVVSGCRHEGICLALTCDLGPCRVRR